MLLYIGSGSLKSGINNFIFERSCILLFINIARFLDGLILMSGIFSTSIVVNMANHPMNVDS